MEKTLLSSPQVTMEHEFLNQYRDNFDESLKKAINQSGINIQKEVTAQEIHFMQMYMDGDITWTKVKNLIDRMGEKTVCNIFSNGNLAEFNDWKKDLQAIESDLKNADKNGSSMYVTEDVGKLMQDHTTGDHAPTHSTHFGKGLGDNAGFVSRYNTGYVWRLFADGYIRQIEPTMVKKLFFERYDIIPSELEAKTIADLLNKERRIFEGQVLQGNIGDSKIVQDAVSIITNEGKKKGLSYQKTDAMGKEVRRACEKIERDAGKIIGKAKVDGATPEITQKYAKMVSNVIEETNMTWDNFISCLFKIKKKNR